jgi:hypothetical protein
MIRRLTITVGIALALAACHGKQADAGKSAAAAEVLPGSASDAMIAYDTLKSQPPMAAPEHSAASEGDDRPVPAIGAARDVPSEAPPPAPPTDAAPAASTAPD